MLVGVPKEIKDNEYRVGMVPSTVRELADNGHQVLVETAAGAGAGLPDADYRAAGAEIVADADAVYGRAELVVKVKEPLAVERKKLRRGQVLFAYLHLAPDRAQTEDLLRSGVTAIAYETVTSPQGTLPLLTPMSEVAGRMAPHVGAHCLEKENGGRGVLLCGVPGVSPATVVVLGGGVAGTNAALIASGMGAEVAVLDRNPEVLRRIDAVWAARTHAVLHPRRGRASVPARRCRHRHGAGARRQGAETDLRRDGEGDEAGRSDRRRRHRPGRLRRDLAADHAFAPDLYRRRRRALLRGQHAGRGRAHVDLRAQQRYPGFVHALADKGWRLALADDAHLRDGLNVHDGRLTYSAVAEALDLPYTPADEALR